MICCSNSYGSIQIIQFYGNIFRWTKFELLFKSIILSVLFTFLNKYSEKNKLADFESSRFEPFYKNSSTLVSPLIQAQIITKKTHCLGD